MKFSIILALALNDCKSKYAGSFLGSLWAFIGPLVTIGIYWFVYTVALNGGEVQGVPYLLWLLTGISPWFFFADAISGTAACFRDYSFLVKKLRFRAEYLPLVRVCSAFFVHVVFLAVIYLIISCLGVTPSINQLWIFCWILGGFLLCLGLGKLISLCCVRIHDMIYAAGVAVQLGFWITPVFWSPDSLPEGLYWLAQWNPVAILVEGYRNALLFGKGVNAKEFIIFWCVVIFLNVLGQILMKRLRPTIADYL